MVTAFRRKKFASRVATEALLKKRKPPHIGSVGFVVRPPINHLVVSLEILLPRLVIVRVQLKRIRSINIINCYLPTESAEEHELTTFHYELEEAIRSDKSYYNTLSVTSLSDQGGKMKANIGMENLDYEKEMRMWSDLQETCPQHVS
ncbi:hypothetical protein KIN20_004665 [Parelaphostrongylus tenuis]|uniref:Uncharacterized protein n=1 Tax=Parelaphostrongylus tenuis TaxID=148309 RepID=A0AAD5QJH6_PARTN|nr:hypothetical protein KIN20_004665 [Parelaphostrongylus tenuis]